MSSNPADTPIPLPRLRWSLTARLALLTALSSFVILAAVTFYLYFTLANQLKTQNALYLMDEVETLCQMARLSGFRDRLADEMHVDPVGEIYLYYYLRLLDREGRVVIETPNMENFLPSGVFPPAGKSGTPHREVAVRGRNGSSYLVTSVWLNTELAKDATLQVGLDVTNVEKILHGIRNKLAVALIAGTLLCAGSGLVCARRGTRPIREITEQARHITSSSLNERLSGAEWPWELRDMADALNGMYDRLQDSFIRMYTSATNLSHKLRTPLTIIIGQGEVALAHERSAEELREVIASNVEECERISYLINNVLFISQVEIGKLQPVLIKIKARAEIDKVLDFYTPLAEEKGITLTCKGNAFLAADPLLFRKAVANLLSNALIFTPQGGSVEVNVRQDDDGSAEVFVSDTGCGIAEEEIRKIFDWFYRVYATRFKDPHGSGLGLPIVSTIMELHNGAVDVRSRPGEGTKAILKFPPPAGRCFPELSPPRRNPFDSR